MGQAPTISESRKLAKLLLLTLLHLLLPIATDGTSFLSINVLRILFSASPHAPPHYSDLNFLLNSDLPAPSLESDFPPFDPVSCFCGSAAALDDSRLCNPLHLIFACAIHSHLINFLMQIHWHHCRRPQPCSYRWPPPPQRFSSRGPSLARVLPAIPTGVSHRRHSSRKHLAPLKNTPERALLLWVSRPIQLRAALPCGA